MSLLNNPEKPLTHASWCVRTGVGRILPPGGTAWGRSDSHTNWRAPGIALWTGAKLRWIAEKARVNNHNKANRHLAREVYRAPWSLPVG